MRRCSVLSTRLSVCPVLHFLPSPGRGLPAGGRAWAQMQAPDPIAGLGAPIPSRYVVIEDGEKTYQYLELLEAPGPRPRWADPDSSEGPVRTEVFRLCYIGPGGGSHPGVRGQEHSKRISLQILSSRKCCCPKSDSPANGLALPLALQRSPRPPGDPCPGLPGPLGDNRGAP